MDRKLFSEFVTDYLNNSCKRRSDDYRSMYLNTLSHVLAYCSSRGINDLYTDDIDLEFCDNFVYFLQAEQNLMQNTIKGIMERLGAILRKAVTFGYPVNNSFEEVKVDEEEVSAVYFSLSEIRRIYRFKKLTRFQSEIRDLFVIGCLTGLRYSDYSRLDEKNFDRINGRIIIKTKKTGVPVTIPMHKYVREILIKYDYSLPEPRCISYFNRAVKVICKKVGFNEPVLWERTVGLNVISQMKPKWKLVSSHTARRSFITNMLLQKDIPTFRIMLITGHKSERSFIKYNGITKEENAMTLEKHAFFR